ncbi:MAG: lipoyl(octanoyl) transferase LipB [Dysgonamonadaceae bacterium]|jgi:lipoyl(octanoyl) transferase|nr:lipoyl(octanoyl) transferase LipB [Dysgonamonadaceae bacterium]
MRQPEYADWGLTPYAEAYERQKALFDAAVERKTDRKPARNTLIFCEHPHVITIGKHGSNANLLLPEEILKEKQIPLFHVDRGGDVTYHGPGQLVGYPILDLESFRIGLKEYIYRIEAAVIDLLAEYNIKGERLAGAAGVWINAGRAGEARKICAVGVKSSRYVTMHGFALNVFTDLEYFNLINPCGFKDKGVTSMEQELAREVAMGEVKGRLLACFVRRVAEG